MCEEKIKNRHGNGFFRSRKRQQKLEKKFKTKSNEIWTSGVYFDEKKNRLEWFCNLWHRKFWKKIANHRVRHKKEIIQNGGYKKIFYMTMNCDRVSLITHEKN